MEWRKVYRLYNKRQLKSTRLLYLFIVVSVMIAVTISLAIPQVIFEMEQHANAQAAKENGADLLIEAPFKSSAFDKKLQTLSRQEYRIANMNVMTTGFEKGHRNVAGGLIVGTYSLGENEMILSADLAKNIGASIGDLVQAEGAAYTIKAIEKTPTGVDEQSRTIGYGKVGSTPLDQEAVFTRLIGIDGPQIANLKKQFTEIEKGYTYTTIEDRQTAIRGEIDLNAGVLNVLNTIAYIMTILSVMSSIFMIMMKRQHDIAVMRTLSIPIAVIKKAFAKELYLLFLIPVCAGSLLSLVLAQLLLSANGLPGISWSGNTFIKLLSGTVLYLFIYLIFIRISLTAAQAIRPLSLIKNEFASLNRAKRKIAFISILAIVLSLSVYSVYLGKGTALLSSFLIIVLMLLFFGIILVGLRIYSVMPVRNRLFGYHRKNIKKNRYSLAIIILSLTLTCLFMLIGFTMERTVSSSYTTGVEKKLNYNYLASSAKPDEFEASIKSDPQIAAYTKLYALPAVAADSRASNSLFSVRVASISAESYGAKYNKLEGEELFEGAANEVLVSKELSTQIGKSVGDELQLSMEGRSDSLKIKGIYESGGVNSSFVLIQSKGVPQGKPVFAINASSETFADRLEGTSIMHINVVGTALLHRMQSFLTLFKWLCWICIFSSLLFNLNFVYINYKNEFKDMVIVRALGLGKSFIYRHFVLRSLLFIWSSLLLSLFFYWVLCTMVLQALFHVPLQLPVSSLFLPAGSSLLLVVLISIVPFRLLKHSHGFQELREQV